MENSIYLFLNDTLTNYHKLSGFCNTTLFSYSPGGQRSEMGISREQLKCQQGIVISEDSRGEFISSIFQFLETIYIPWLHFSTLKVSSVASFFKKNWSIIALQCYYFMLYSKVNELYVYICPLPLEPPSHPSSPTLPLQVITEHRAKLPVLQNSFPLIILHMSSIACLNLLLFCPSFSL